MNATKKRMSETKETKRKKTECKYCDVKVNKINRHNRTKKHIKNVADWKEKEEKAEPRIDVSLWDVPITAAAPVAAAPVASPPVSKSTIRSRRFRKRQKELLGEAKFRESRADYQRHYRAKKLLSTRQSATVDLGDLETYLDHLGCPNVDIADLLSTIAKMKAGRKGDQV